MSVIAAQFCPEPVAIPHADLSINVDRTNAEILWFNITTVSYVCVEDFYFRSGSESGKCICKDIKEDGNCANQPIWYFSKGSPTYKFIVLSE